MKRKIPVFSKDKSEEVSIKIRKLDTNFSMDEANHRHTYEELIFIKSGTGRQLIDNKIYTIQPNILYFISKGQVHNFEEGQAMEAYVIGFDANFLSTYAPIRFAIILKKLTNFTSLPLDNESIYELGLIIQQMLTEYNRPKSTIGRNENLINFLSILLTYIERIIHKIAPQHKSLKPNYKFATYQNFLQLIEKYYKTHHHLSFYTQQLGVSARNLTSYAKTYSGKTAKQLISHRIISEAKRLLIFTSQNLKEITTNLGFEETSYFIRFFRIQTDITPGAFRTKEQV